jgi:hypothetical protein
VSASLLATKLIIPPQGKIRVDRPHLLQALDESLQPGCRLVLISAPAGFGKTTLMSAWMVWSYAVTHRRLLSENADQSGLKRVARIMLLVAIGLAFAIPLAYLSVYLAYAIWIICAPVSAWWVRKRYKHTTQKTT